MEKLMAVFDTDILYASRLMEYLKKSGWEEFGILLFTRRESLVDFLKYQAVDILLYGGEDISAELLKDNIKYIFWLSHDKKAVRDKQESIYKYQPAGRIASAVLSGYTRLEDNRGGANYGEVRFISVFSPVPGIEKRSYAWALAKELSDRRKVLFISLDPLQTAFMPGEKEAGESMSEFLYYLKESGSNYMDKLKTYLNYSDRLPYLAGVWHGFDLLSLSREDVEKFIKDMAIQKDYELIVFYLGIYTEAAMEILSRSNDIYIAIADLPYEELAVKEWERQMELMGVFIRQLKCHRIKLPAAGRMAGASSSPEHIYAAIKPAAEEAAQIYG